MRATEMIDNLTRNLKMDIAKGRAGSVAICESLENYLCPAALIVNLLGQLVLLSSIKDFPLDAHPPKDGYQYMKWPKSFRASLAQVMSAELIFLYFFIILFRFSRVSDKRSCLSSPAYYVDPRPSTGGCLRFNLCFCLSAFLMVSFRFGSDF